MCKLWYHETISSIHLKKDDNNAFIISSFSLFSSLSHSLFSLSLTHPSHSYSLSLSSLSLSLTLPLSHSLFSLSLLSLTLSPSLTLLSLFSHSPPYISIKSQLLNMYMYYKVIKYTSPFTITMSTMSLGIIIIMWNLSNQDTSILRKPLLLRTLCWSQYNIHCTIQPQFARSSQVHYREIPPLIVKCPFCDVISSTKLTN